jgi:ABC-type multidrug transport system ATPase subunit
MIRIEELSKRFNNLVALENINLHIKKGETFALLGPNGAGKTTLVKVLSTLLKPTSGHIYLNGVDALVEPEEAKRHIGVVSHNPFLYDELSAIENLEFYSSLYDCKPNLSTLLTRVNLEKRGHDLVGTYSRGMKQRLSIARAILHDPEILIFDEPTSGLDLPSRRNFYELVGSLKQEKKTFLLTTHYLEEAIALCSRGVILNKGKVVSEVDLTSSEKELEKIFSRLEK